MKKWLFILISFLGAAPFAFGAVTPNKTDFVDYCTGPNNTNCVFQIDSLGSMVVVGTTTHQTTTAFTPLLITGISSTTIISPSATYIQVVSSGANVSCGLGLGNGSAAAPCISTSTAVNGQYLVIGGTSSVSTVTFTDGTASGMQLGAATRLIDNLKKLTVIFDTFDSQWKEVSFGNN